MIDYDPDGSLEGIYDNTYKIPMFVNNGTTVNLMPTAFYAQATFLHHLPKHDATGEIIQTGNGTIKAHFWTDIQINVQGCLLQLKILVCDTQATTGILLSHMALEQLQTWQDYGTNTMYIKHVHNAKQEELKYDHMIEVAKAHERTCQEYQIHKQAHSMAPPQ